MDTVLEQVKKKANEWLNGPFDEQTKNQVKELVQSNETELIDSFYKPLEFGTGGLRGIMGVGSNRMNIYTVGMATQGLSNYIKKEFASLPEIKVAIAYDSRNNSKLFAESTAQIFAANGFRVYLFESLRPTPELSFAIRYFGCQSGVVITASHNPKEYNGYKAYWNDGGQVIAPHDKNIITEVEKITSPTEVKFEGNKHLITLIGAEVDEVYTDKVKALSVSPEVIARQKDMKIVFTPIHGTGVELVPMILKKFGFNNIIRVPEQDTPDGNFPTVKSPNPEESAALNMAIEKAKAEDAELVMATDPDADRVGIAVKDKNNQWILLNGNQTGAVLSYYMLTQWKAKGKLTGKEYTVKTIVTTELLASMAQSFNVEYFDVLTGFKFIADIIKKNEGKKTFIVGGEESYGYLAGDFVRDKDAIMACALIAEAAAWAKDNGKSLYELLIEIYTQYGLYAQGLVSLTKKGKAGADEIKQMMVDFRSNPPKQLDGSDILVIKDYQKQLEFDVKAQSQKGIELPKSDVLQFFTADGSKITVRPSGTEPKIKFYFEVKAPLCCAGKYDATQAELDAKIERIKKELGI